MITAVSIINFVRSILVLTSKKRRHTGTFQCRLFILKNVLSNFGLTLVMIRGKYTLVMIGGGTKCPPPLFLFVKTIEKVIRLCTVLKKKSLSGSFEDRGIFNDFCSKSIYLSPKLREKWLYL